MTTTTITPLAIREIQENAALNLAAGRALITRSYLSELEQYPVANPDQRVAFSRASDMRIYRIERIVQDNKQSVLESTTAAYTALGAAGYSVFLFLRSDGRETELFIGTRGEPGKMLGHNSGELLRETFKGHFPGSALQPLNAQDANALLDKMDAEKGNPSASITAVTGVPALSTENRDHFMQGLERFIDAAELRVYQALILAEPISSQSLDVIRTGYEQVATQLSPLLKRQLSFGEQESDAVGLSISQSLSESLGESLGLTETTGTSIAETTGTSDSQSNPTTSSKVASIALTSIGAAAGTILLPGAGTAFGAQAGGLLGSAFSKQETTGTNQSSTISSSAGESISQTTTTTHTKGLTDSQSHTQTQGSSKQISLESVDKSIEQLLSKIDHHLQRIDEAKTYGGWNSAAYFIGDSSASSESLASIFLGLIRGNKSSHEDFALTTWTSDNKSAVLDWLTRLSHPELKPGFAKRVPVSFVTPATLVSGKEMAIQLSLPRRSTSTVSVVETQAFGRKVQRLDGLADKADARKLNLGNIRHLWENLPQRITLDLDNLTSHVFVSGSTGSGKSNTLYSILDQISAADIPFLVVEPAKGEYKHVFGHRDEVSVLGTNPHYTDLLRINPFRFPAGIHVLEHIDRLIEIFNICWPMYAAMPAVLKDATLKAYRNCGWDLDDSTNLDGCELFPSFTDLLQALEQVIENSAYSQEVKSNYIGSLSTRVESLTNGLNGQIFTDNEVGDEVLFNSRVIVDLSRVGSSETKALIMGLLVMRLSEYRMAQGSMNQPLRHVTVLEEAHNILRRNPAATPEGAGVASKAVEMLSNAIAEMRTYGEGFIIVDQSPGAVDIAAIRNTNTKIILRLPEEADRHLIGKSIALRDEQLDEIAKLPRGVAIVYQNDWLEPVMCQVDKFPAKEEYYRCLPEGQSSRKKLNREILKLLLRERLGCNIDRPLIEQGLSSLSLEKDAIALIRKELDEHFHSSETTPAKQGDFPLIARKVISLLGCRQRLECIHEYSESPGRLVVKLDNMVRDFAGDTPTALRLSIQQCMLDDSVRQNSRNHGAYAAWREEIVNRGKI
ncbi:ATP-binding protein [Pseudomonadaceae bacterium T75]|nr:ATP-binding protein [Pseudomonadaceae bacterium T75]